ncbi:MAG: hypothetical protein M3Z85_19685, partial [Acidobacteriota bacterium]|nr:hypothetical protein [Acidobacteriota bacterium]
MPKKWRLAAAFLVFLAALFVLGFNLQNAAIASGFIDPVTRLGAQDESLYTREAIHMATGGGWLTPMYLGRFVLFKP